MDFKKELEEYKNKINAELEKHLIKENCYEKKLNKSIEYSLMAGGKRIRPILVIATYRLFKEDYEKCYPYAVAAEMVHNFSLIHDDLPGIDNDDFRHGKPTNHKAFNEATAILAGDFLLNNAYAVISRDIKKINTQEIGNKIRVFNEFSNAINKLIIGEYVDTEDEGKDISQEELKYIHENKTGELLKLCVRMGAILAGASELDVENLTKYAKNIGLAFQIKDDILSEEGDEKVLGKPVGNDKKRKKCTYVSQYGLEKSKETLQDITGKAITCVKQYNNSEFLVELAKYIANRDR
mgnify:FL=1